MRFITLLPVMLWPLIALADVPASAGLSNQQLLAVDYESNGRQTGCGLRALGDTPDGLALNVLVTVFNKGDGATFGVLKVVARKRLEQDGKPAFADLGKIQHAWIAAASGKRPLMYKDGESAHGDAYMANAEFGSMVEFLGAMAQEDFDVGLSRNVAEPDEAFHLNARLSREDAGKFSLCMSRLKAGLADDQHRERF